MKRILVILFVIPGFLFFISCNIESPYIDALSDKIDSDKSSDDLPPADDNPTSDGVATVTNFTASVESYDSVNDLGVIKLTWDAPVVTGNQTTADRIVVRENEAVNPTGLSSGTAVFDGAGSATMAQYNNASLGFYPHFGIWTVDADGNVSTGQFDNVSIQKDSVSILYDGYIYWGMYTEFSDTNNPVNYSGTSDSYCFIKFNNLPVYNKIIRADLGLYLYSSGTCVDIELSRVNAAWTSGSSFNTLNTLSVSSIGSFSKGTLNAYTRWDVTATVIDWGSSADYGFRMNDTANGSNTAYYSNENTSNKPKLDIYYESE